VLAGSAGAKSSARREGLLVAKGGHLLYVGSLEREDLVILRIEALAGKIPRSCV
jgi:hypothetical protein